MAKKAHGTRGHSVRSSTDGALVLVGVAIVVMLGFLGATQMVGNDLVAASPSTASTVWLCRPGLSDNPCTSNLTTTVVRANGSTSVQRGRPARNPPIDCFYVYP